MPTLDDSRYYFTGIRCRNGHISKRFHSNKECYECCKAQWKSQREKNQEARARYKKLPKIVSANIQWQKNNPDRVRIYGKKYRKTHPEQVRANIRNYAAKKREAGGRHSAGDIFDILRMQNKKCAYCRVTLRGKYHVDHIVPVIAGGSNDRSNLQILCPPCNLSKSAKDPLIFAQELGFLL